MIADPVAKLLVGQVASELTAHQVYMGISVYFTRQSLNAWAKHFRDQALEEADHGWKIINFLVDNDVDFSLPQVGGAPTTYKSARDALGVAQASEQRVTQAFETIANAAREAKDNRSLEFVHWFIAEQVEEERTVAALIELVESGINLFDAEAHLERVTAES